MSEIRLCPHCAVGLESVQLLEENPIEVDVCPACSGLWLDTGELESVLEAAKEPGAQVNRHLLTSLCERNELPHAVKYIKCPLCEQIMNRRCYGHRSGVIVDSCRLHGVWLDGGELETLFSWVAAGGHVLSEQVDAERERAERRRREERRIRTVHSEHYVHGGGISAGMAGTHRGGFGRALGDLLAGLFYR